MSNIEVKKLQDVCQIQLGYQFRKRFEHDLSGNYSVIQMKDVEDYSLNISELLKVKIEKVKKEYLISKNTILFMPRGFNNDAILIKEDLEDTIATSQFYILKVADQSILPEYLTWYINQRPAQKYFVSNRAGTSILIINIGQLKELEVRIPDIKTQENIVKAYDLSRREKQIYQEITEKRHHLINEMLLSKINL
ncbi:MAG: restriction endonuclease subunit S [bacterium]